MNTYKKILTRKMKIYTFEKNSTLHSHANLHSIKFLIIETKQMNAHDVK